MTAPRWRSGATPPERRLSKTSPRLFKTGPVLSQTRGPVFKTSGRLSQTTPRLFKTSLLVSKTRGPVFKTTLSKVRAGHRSAILSVLDADPAARKRAGISEHEVADLAEAWAAYQRVDEVLPAVEKLAELVHETRLLHGHSIATRLGEMASQIRRRAERAQNGPELLAPFEALLDYHSTPARKAASTREKAKAEAGEAEAPPAWTPG